MEKAKPKSVLYLPFLIIGFNAISTQVLMMRELFVSFYGNELSLGTALAVWLLFSGLGSMLLPRLMKKNMDPSLWIIRIQEILALLTPAAFFTIRSSKHLFHATPGELFGFIPMLEVAFLTLAPLCLFSGFLYFLGCRLLHSLGHSPSFAIGRTYLLEALGSGIGGILSSTLFLLFLHPFQITVLISMLHIVSCLIIQQAKPPDGMKHKSRYILAVFLLIGMIITLISGPVQNFANRLAWPHYHLIASLNTPHGNLAAAGMGDQVSLYANGLLMATAPDLLTAEENAHYALLQHENPRDILLIGGGLGGALQEMLKHPSVVRIDYVELDPASRDFARRYFPQSEQLGFNDPRIHYHAEDGRRYVRNTGRRYDIVIIHLPNPYTAQLNRFYTIKFFKRVRDVLKDGGILAHRAGASENMIGPEMADFLRSVNNTLGSVFTYTVALPGETVRFFASDDSSAITDNPFLMIKRLQKRQITTQYVREYYIPYQFSQERRQFLKSVLGSSSPFNINDDFKPIGYYFDTVLWATYFSGGFKILFQRFSTLSSFQFFIAGICISLLVLLAAGSFRSIHRIRSSGIRISVICVGFTEICMELILLLAFQIFYGYIYQYLALILAAYMGGLSLGSGLGTRDRATPSDLARFRLFQAYMMVYPVTIALMFFFGEGWLSGLPETAGLAVFMAMITVSGIIGGYQFPVANRLQLQMGRSFRTTAGGIYGMDLIGSAAGAFLVSAFFIPVFGIFETLALLTGFNAFALLLLIPGRSTASNTACIDI